MQKAISAHPEEVRNRNIFYRNIACRRKKFAPTGNAERFFKQTPGGRVLSEVDYAK